MTQLCYLLTFSMFLCLQWAFIHIMLLDLALYLPILMFSFYWRNPTYAFKMIVFMVGLLDAIFATGHTGHFFLFISHAHFLLQQFNAPFSIISFPSFLGC